MPERLRWERGSERHHFIAYPTGDRRDGRAEVWWHPKGTDGPASWHYRLVFGETIESHPADSKQHAADQATANWEGVAGRERTRKAKQDEIDDLEAMINAALEVGVVSIAPFRLDSSTYDRLVRINDILRTKGLLQGPLRPLAEAVSGELYRRRQQR